MLSCRVVQLRFDAFFEKSEGLFPVFVEKDSRKPERLLWTEVQHDVFDVHLFPSLQPSSPEKPILIIRVLRK